jgi:hypothetical protein
MLGTSGLLRVIAAENFDCQLLERLWRHVTDPGRTAQDFSSHLAFLAQAKGVESG